MEVRPIKKLKAMRMARKAMKERPAEEMSGEFLQPEEETEMLKGYKTYIGIATAFVGVALGWLGIGEADASSLAASIVGAVDQLITVAGLALAAYGRSKAS
jgi:hypothetical protein